MNININDTKMNVNVSNSNKDILLETNKIDAQLDNSSLNISTVSENLDINLGISKIVTHEKNHANLENLDFENSGHTGFQPAGDYALKNELPTKTSQLENDIGFLTEHQDLSAYAKKTDIPDTSNFVTKDVEELTNYYIKDEIDGMMIDLEEKIVEMIGDIETLLSEV